MRPCREVRLVGARERGQGHAHSLGTQEGGVPSRPESGGRQVRQPEGASPSWELQVLVMWWSGDCGGGRCAPQLRGELRAGWSKRGSCGLGGKL